MKMRTFYPILTISHMGGSISELLEKSTPDCSLFAVRGIDASELTEEERDRFTSKMSAYGFKVRALSYDDAIYWAYQLVERCTNDEEERV